VRGTFAHGGPTLILTREGRAVGPKCVQPVRWRFSRRATASPRPLRWHFRLELTRVSGPRCPVTAIVSSDTWEVTCFWHARGRFCASHLVVSGAKRSRSTAAWLTPFPAGCGRRGGVGTIPNARDEPISVGPDQVEHSDEARFLVHGEEDESGVAQLRHAVAVVRPHGRAEQPVVRVIADPGQHPH